MQRGYANQHVLGIGTLLIEYIVLIKNRQFCYA